MPDTSGFIDLRSDTVTLPCAGMRKAMHDADVGDDVYGEDPTVRKLEEVAAQLLGKSAGLFMPTGTQSNLAALLTHCARGDEYIVGQQAHTYKYEGGGAAVLGGIQPQPLDLSPDGTLDLDMVRLAIKPRDFHFARTTLLCLENTMQGKVLPMKYVQKLPEFANRHSMKLHLDGARVFNASIALGVDVRSIADAFQTVSICLSKGLGAPVGSVLLGSESFIQEARRWRKVTGGGMRQSGVLAAAGLYALGHNVERLEEDHRRARSLGAGLQSLGYPVESVQTNMVYVHLGERDPQALSLFMLQRGVKITCASRTRLVTHAGVQDDDIDKVLQAFVNSI